MAENNTRPRRTAVTRAEQAAEMPNLHPATEAPAEAGTPATQPVLKPRKTKNVKSLEALVDTPIEKLRDLSEAKAVAKHFKETFKDCEAVCQQQYETLTQLDKRNKEFEQLVERMRQDMETQRINYQAKLEYARQAIDHCRTSIILNTAEAR